MSNQACCAHLRVSYRTKDDAEGRTTGWWECDYNCGARFVTVRGDTGLHPATPPVQEGMPTAGNDDCRCTHQRGAHYGFVLGYACSLCVCQKFTPATLGQEWTPTFPPPSREDYALHDEIPVPLAAPAAVPTSAPLDLDAIRKRFERTKEYDTLSVYYASANDVPALCAELTTARSTIAAQSAELEKLRKVARISAKRHGYPDANHVGIPESPHPACALCAALSEVKFDV